MRRTMVGAPPSSTPLKETGKSFFKANPPRRDAKSAGGNDEDDAEMNANSGSASADEDNGSSTPQQESTPATAKDEAKDDPPPPAPPTSSAAADDATGSGEPPVKRRRRKRRIRLTDTGIKPKKRVDKKAIKEANEGTDSKNDGSQSPTKKEKEPPEEPIVEKSKLSQYSSFQLLCDHILRKLIHKDPEEFFANPVSPSMAPDYLTIIQEPMDYMTIRQRIDDNYYSHIEKFRADVNLIWENAMTYNQPNTVYYVAAQKLSALVKFYISDQYLEYVRYSLPFGKDLSAAEIFGENSSFSKSADSQKQNVPRMAKRKRGEYVSDDLRADDIIKSAESKLKSRLTSRVPTCGVGYLDNREGALALNVLVGAAERGTRLTLADVVPPLEAGNPGLLSLTEPRLCQDYAISYTDPGPYATFAPQFDSTWATLNKYDSELMFACYGDRANAADALALHQFVEGCATYDDDMELNISRHVDALLDSMTDGEHSRTMKALEAEDRPPKLAKFTAKALSRSSMLELLENVSSLQNFGLDLAFINDLKAELGLLKTDVPPVTGDALLKHTGAMIADLATMNYARLGGQPPLTLTDAVGPLPAEIHLAEGVLNGLSEGIESLGVKPEDVVSTQAVHKSLGLAGDDDDDDYDYDLLREFMCVDDLEIDAK